MKITDARSGFTLVETLGALAIGSMIILSAGALLHQSVFFFDRGTRSVDKSEELALAIETLTRDIGAARYVLQRNATGLTAAFTGAPAGDGASATIVFVTASGREPNSQSDEVVSLTAQVADGFAQLVRRRAPWPGPRMQLTEAQPGDAVILLKGKYDISFSFSEVADGRLNWYDSWTGDTGLPHSVRLNLHDMATGADLLIGSVFPIHADAPITCAIGAIGCISLAKAKPAAPPQAVSRE